MASASKENDDKGGGKQKRSLIDTLYVKLLKDPSTNFIIVLVGFVFIIWMVIPLFTVLTGAVYFNGQWSGAPIANVFTDELYFNFAGEEGTSFYTKGEEPYGGPTEAVAVSNGIAYLAERGLGIEILNVTDPNNIVEIQQYYDELTSFKELEIEGDLLYTAAGKSGLVIFNISDIEESFKPLSEIYNLANSTTFLNVVGDYVYLGIDEQGFAIINATDPSNPEVLSRNTRYEGYAFGEKVKDIAIKDDYAFLVGYDTGMVVLDISNKSNPIELYRYNHFPASTETLTPQSIEIVNDTAYLAADKEGLVAFNISDVANVSTLGFYNLTTNTRADDVYIGEDYACLLTSNHNLFEYDLRIIDISDPSNLTLTNSFQSIGYINEDLWLDPANDLIYVARSGAGLMIIDSQDIYVLQNVGIYEDTIMITVITLSGKNHGVVLNTIKIGILTTIFSVILGVALAFILARYEFPGKRLVSLLALAPLIIPPFISGMGFRLILGPNGFLNNFFLIPAFETKLVFSGIFAIVFVQTSHFYALVYLNAFSSFLNIDPSMEESAENLGAGRLRLFSTVTLPLAMPGIGAGAILVLILAMEDVGTPIIFAAMGDNAAKKVLPYHIFENYSKAGSAEITPEICVLGGILLIIALLGFFAIRKYVSLRTYSMVSKGRAGHYRLTKAKWKLLFIYPFLIVLFAFSLLVHVGVFLMSIMETLGGTKPSDIKFTFENYKLVFVSSRYNIPNYVINTLIYSVIATMLIIVIGTLAAYVVSRKNFRGKGVLDAIVTLPIAIPGIVLAIGYYRTFDWSGIVSRNPTWFNRMMANVTASLKLDPFIGVAVTLLIMSYTIRKIPFTLRSAYAGLQQVDTVLEEASFNLGATRMRTMGKITIPLISLNIFAGSLVSFLYCLSEVSTTIFLIFSAQAGTITWYMAWNPLKFQIFCALGVLLMLLQIFSLFITNVILGSRAEAITGI
ncbi:MAG: ABC transporter permease subunit [Candidatus Heimdallarchaeota archaeon]|nr:ABC transporter permease subunit [Candidatus Heimdallarchaeota archaeon]